jgi:hypothetical protein
VHHPELAYLNAFPNKMDVELNVLSALVVDGVRRHVDRRHIVAEHNRGLADATVKLAE